MVAESSELCPEAPQGVCEAGTSHTCLGVLRQGLGCVSREQAQGGAGAHPPPRAAPCGPVAMPHWLPGHPLGGSQLWSLWPRARGELRKLWVALQEGRSGEVCLAPGSTDTRDKGYVAPGDSPQRVRFGVRDLSQELSAVVFCHRLQTGKRGHRHVGWAEGE